MKKDDLIKGIGSVDDKLISEAAKTPSGRRPKISFRLKRTLTIAAAAAGAAAVVLFMHLHDVPSPEEISENRGDGLTAEIYTEKSGSAEKSTGTQTSPAHEISVRTDTTAVSSSAKLAETTTAPADKAIAVTSPPPEQTQTLTEPPHEEITPPADENSVQTSTYPPDRPAESIDIFDPAENYSYPGNEEISGVQYGSRLLAERDNIWLNCTKEQADRWLGYVSSFTLSDTYEEIEFTGGGYMLRILYKDGTHEDYELFTPDYYLIYTDRQGNVSRFKETSHSGLALHNEIYDAYLANINVIDKTVQENRTW